MRRLTLLTLIVVSFGVAAYPALGADDSDLKILTYPIGLVTGAHPIETDLGAEGEPAELFLDGVPVCSFQGSNSSCTVDLGDAPHVHLLELIRRDDQLPATVLTRVVADTLEDGTAGGHSNPVPSPVDKPSKTCTGTTR